MNLAIAENRLRRAWKSEIANQVPSDLTNLEQKILKIMADGRERLSRDICVSLSQQGLPLQSRTIGPICGRLCKKGLLTADRYSHDGPTYTIYRRAV